MSELYSRLHEEVELRLEEAERVVRSAGGRCCSKCSENIRRKIRSHNCNVSCRKEKSKILLDVAGIEPATPCLQSKGVPSNNSIPYLGLQCFQQFGASAFRLR